MQTVNRHIYLASKQSCFNQYQVDPTCKLCSVAPDTRQHFVPECSVFKIERNIFKPRKANYTACSQTTEPLANYSGSHRTKLNYQKIGKKQMSQHYSNQEKENYQKITDQSV